jgi:hypothetical protein
MDHRVGILGIRLQPEDTHFTIFTPAQSNGAPGRADTDNGVIYIKKWFCRLRFGRSNRQFNKALEISSDDHTHTTFENARAMAPPRRVVKVTE